MEGGGHLPTAGILRTTPTVGSHMGDDSPAGRAQFEALYAAEGRRVLAYALRRTAQPADAADVLAEVFLVAWRRLDDVPAGAEARLWLYGVARGVMANHRRSLRRRERLGRRLAGTLTEHLVPDPAELTELGGGDDAVRAALARLTPTDREVIQLSIWEGLSAPEVATVLGVPPATVRTRLHRARRRLRSLLAEPATVPCSDARPGPRSGRPSDRRAGEDRRPTAPGGDRRAGDDHRSIAPGVRVEHPAPVGHVGADGHPPVREHEDHR